MPVLPLSRRLYVVVAFAGPLLAGCAKPAAKAPSEPVAVIAVRPIETGTVAVEVPVVGTVVAVDSSKVAAGAAGKVVSFPFREGALVREGDLLAQLRDVTISIELQSAKELLKEREHRHAQLVAGFRPEEIAQAEATMLSATAALKLAESTTARVQSLYERPDRPVSEQDLEEAVFEAERTRQELAKAEADFQLKKNGYRSEEIAAAAAAAEAQRQEVSRLTDELEKRKVVAPFTGYLVEKLTDVGEWVDIGGAVATLVKLDEVEIRINVEEEYIEEIQVGQTVDVRVDALGAPSQSAEFTGHVRAVVPRSRWEQGSRSFPVVVRVVNRMQDEQPVLKEGMVARITFRGPPREAMLAHKDAILRSDGRAKLYVIDDDHRARAVEVEEGLSNGALIEVRGPLRVGDLVATAGAERLRPMAAVSFDPPPARVSPAADPAVVERRPTEAEAKNTGG